MTTSEPGFHPLRCTVVAEIGSVHDGSLGNALHLVDLAAGIGVDAVKFQTHLASAETLPDAPGPTYFQSESRFAYFDRIAFSTEEWGGLRERCAERGVTFMSSPFSLEAVELLEEVGVESYKVASGEVTNLPLLRAVAQTGKPVVLSSGMSSWRELDVAVEALTGRHDRLTVLQCTSMYPCPPERVGLNVMREMHERYGHPVGLSDHTTDNYAAFAAAAHGASMVEKHLTFSRRMYGSDAANAAEPDQFEDLVRGIRSIEAVIGSPVDKDDVVPYAEMKAVFEKSLVSLRDIPRGAPFTGEVVGVKKPGTGIPAARYDEVLTLSAARDIPAGRVMVHNDVQWEPGGAADSRY